MQLFHFHNWSKWSSLVETLTGHKQQWRVCKDCGKVQFTTLPWDKQSSISHVKEEIQRLKANEC